MWKYFLRPILLLLLALALALAGTAYWFNRHPDAVLDMLNRQLPEGVELRAVRGLGVSPLGGELLSLEAQWDGNRLHARDAHWYWRIDSWWPLRLTPQSLEFEQLRVDLAEPKPSPAEPAPLVPRFWENPWWPRLAPMSLNARRFQINDASGAERYAGSIELQRGGASGNATLQLAGTVLLELQWEPTTSTPDQQSWRVHWQSSAPEATGTLNFTVSEQAIAWQLQALLAQWTVQDNTLNNITLQMGGRSDLFAGTEALATGALRVEGEAQTASGNAAWHCAATLEVAQTLVTQARVSSCRATLGQSTLQLDTPLRLELDDGFTPRLLHLDPGSVQISGYALADWQIESLRLETRATHSWNPEQPLGSIPAVEFSAQLHNPALELGVGINGQLSETTRQTDKWISRVQAALKPVHRSRQLPQIDLAGTVHGDPKRLETQATLRLAALGRLAEITATHDLVKSRHDAKVIIDTRTWSWGKGLLATVFGPKQKLFSGDLLGGDLRADLRLRIDPVNTRLEGTVEAAHIHALAAGVGVAGLAVEPWRFDYRNKALRSLAPLQWRIDSLNTGLVLSALQGVAEQDERGWWLRNARGEVLGGTFSLAEVGPLGADPLEASLQLQGIRLEQVARLLENPDIRLSGSVGGTVPLRLHGGELSVQSGRVASEAAGEIRYLPEAAPENEPGELATARKALSNLQYESLEATLDYQTDGTLVLLTQLRGRNPELDEKRPVHLNLTLETNLRTLLQSLRAGNRVSEWLGKRAAQAKR